MGTHHHEPVRATRRHQPEPPAAEPTDVEHSAPVAGRVLTADPLGAAGALHRAAADTADPLGGTAVSADVDAALRRRRGKGDALAPDVASDFGAQLNADLSGVRVHTDSEADGLARSVASVAFTQGSDIYFSQGKYNPTSSAGQHLLAHELTHVVQHGSGASAGGGTAQIGRADDPAEHEAERSARAIVPALRRRAATGTAAPASAPADGLRRTTIRRDVSALKERFEKGAVAAETDPLKRFEQLAGLNAAPKDADQAKTRMTELRNLATSMTAQQRKVAASNKKLMAQAKTYVGDHEYMSLVAAVSMYAQKYDLATGKGTGKSHHMSGAEADTFIKDNLAAIPHLKPYLEAAVAAGKKADGFVAVVGQDDWAAIYAEQYGGKNALTDGANTNAFIANTHADRPAIINANKGTRSTAIHESMHRYSVLNVLKTYGSGLNEGITEYFTRKITNANGEPAANGGPQRTNYQSNVTFVRAMVAILGANEVEQETALAEIYFNGDIARLKTRFYAYGTGKGWDADTKDDRWDDFDDALGGGQWNDALAAMA